MTPMQEKAAASVARALKKAKQAGLSLRVYSSSVYVVPCDRLPDYADALDACLAHGEEVGNGIPADGGAGR